MIQLATKNPVEQCLKGSAHTELSASFATLD